ncbi:MAG: hypothetical protein ABR592_02255, partial [Nitriliruptorales bacterium]
GPAAAMTALGGVTLVVCWFALSALPLGWVATHRPELYTAVALGGFGARLGGFALAMVLLEPVEALDGAAFAGTVAVGVVALLTAEGLLMLRRPELWRMESARIPTRLEEAMRKVSRAEGTGPDRATATSDGKERP